MKPAIKTGLTLVLLAFILSGCATRNMLADGRGNKAMLGGNDPISYHTQPAPAKGDPKIIAEWDGGTYFFANTKNRELFVKDPKKYVPQYGGYCANGAPYAILLGGNADTYKVVDGRLFMFGGANPKKYWEMDQAENIRLGDHFWKIEMDGVWNPTLHSYRRILFKVPHFKGSEQLEEEWQERQKKK